MSAVDNVPAWVKLLEDIAKRAINSTVAGSGTVSRQVRARASSPPVDP
jgi:hypothetical protein